MRLRAIAIALLAAASSASGDIVTLVDGRRIEGDLVETDDGLVLRARYGEVALDRADVLLVEHKETLEQELARQKAALDPTDPDALGALATWCRAKKLLGEARALEARRATILRERAEAVREAERQLREAVFARRRAEAGDDPVAVFAMARWAEGQGYGRGPTEALLREVLALDPAHEGALGYFARRAAEEKAQAEREATFAAWRAAERRLEAAAEAEEERRDAIARAEQRRVDAETAAVQRQAELADREQALRVQQAELEARAAADQAAAWAAERERAAAQAAWEQQRRCDEEEARRRAWQERRREEERCREEERRRDEQRRREEERRRDEQRRREAEEDRARIERDAIRLRPESAGEAGVRLRRR